MPNLTPPEYRVLYEIYPGKAAVHETADVLTVSVIALIDGLGRTVAPAPAAAQGCARTSRIQVRESRCAGPREGLPPFVARNPTREFRILRAPDARAGTAP